MAAWLLVAGGCSSSSGEDGAASSTTASTTATAPSSTDTTETGDAETTEPGDVDTDALRAGEVTLLDAGAEPREPLVIAGDGRSQLMVDASETLTLTIGGNTTDEGTAATYTLDLDLTVNDTGADLLIAPSAVTVDGSPLGAEGVGTWTWFLEPNGRVQRAVPIGWSEAIDEATIDLLTTTNLVLVTPAEAVGVGAIWSQSLDRQSDAQLVFTLIGATDTDLEVTIELAAPFEQGLATMAMSGTYDRATLLARDLTTESGLEITSPVTDNGDLVELTGVQRSHRTVTEASDAEGAG